MACKPLCDDLCYGNTCNLATHAVDCKAEASHCDLCREADNLACECAVHCIPLDCRAGEHERCTHETCKAYAHLVKDDTSEEEHEQEYVDISVCTREYSVVIASPAKAVDG